jgi:hypothetical protein
MEFHITNKKIHISSEEISTSTEETFIYYIYVCVSACVCVCVSVCVCVCLRVCETYVTSRKSMQVTEDYVQSKVNELSE